MRLPGRQDLWVGGMSDNDMWIQLGKWFRVYLYIYIHIIYVYIYIWFNLFPVFSRVVGYFRWSYIQIVLVIFWRSTKIVVSRCRDGEMQPAILECQCFALLNCLPSFVFFFLTGPTKTCGQLEVTFPDSYLSIYI